MAPSTFTSSSHWRSVFVDRGPRVEPKPVSTAVADVVVELVVPVEVLVAETQVAAEPDLVVPALLVAFTCRHHGCLEQQQGNEHRKNHRFPHLANPRRRSGTHPWGSRAGLSLAASAHPSGRPTRV
jgi:hypothetical protein